uniref:hypothetical protein n=1 Tax=Puniceibacterium confluentis TaxID=1958944 RepID=UPI003568C5C9
FLRVVILMVTILSPPRADCDTHMDTGGARHKHLRKGSGLTGIGHGIYTSGQDQPLAPVQSILFTA